MKEEEEDTVLSCSVISVYIPRLTQRAESQVEAGVRRPRPRDVRPLQRAEPLHRAEPVQRERAEARRRGRVGLRRHLGAGIVGGREADARVDQHPHVDAHDDGDAAQVQVHQVDALHRQRFDGVVHHLDQAHGEHEHDQHRAVERAERHPKVVAAISSCSLLLLLFADLVRCEKTKKKLDSKT